jgi:hypothetical protein
MDEDLAAVLPVPLAEGAVQQVGMGRGQKLMSAQSGSANSAASDRQACSVLVAFGRRANLFRRRTGRQCGGRTQPVPARPRRTSPGTPSCPGDNRDPFLHGLPAGGSVNPSAAGSGTIKIVISPAADLRLGNPR